MVFQQASEISQTVMKAGIIKANMTWWQMLVRSFIAGAFLGFGTLFSIIVGYGSTTLKTTDPGLQKLVYALCFPCGLALIVLCGMELFTGNTMFLVPGLLARKFPLKSLLKNWGLVYLGNFVGAVFFMGIMVYCSGLATTDPYATAVRDITETKCNMNWGYVFIRGVSANWMVCAALFGAAAADDLIGKLFALWFPITLFVACSLEHSIANMCLLSFGLMLGTNNTNVGICLYNNLLPSTLGNIVGGSCFMGLVMYLLYIHTGEIEAHGKIASTVVDEHMRERTDIADKLARRDTPARYPPGPADGSTPLEAMELQSVEEATVHHD